MYVVWAHIATSVISGTGHPKIYPPLSFIFFYDSVPIHAVVWTLSTLVARRTYCTLDSSGMDYGLFGVALPSS